MIISEECFDEYRRTLEVNLLFVDGLLDVLKSEKPLTPRMAQCISGLRSIKDKLSVERLNFFRCIALTQLQSGKTAMKSSGKR